MSNANDAVPSYMKSNATSLQAFVVYLLHRRHLEFKASNGSDEWKRVRKETVMT
jgi:hypothetical protein